MSCKLRSEGLQSLHASHFSLMENKFVYFKVNLDQDLSSTSEFMKLDFMGQNVHTARLCLPSEECYFVYYFGS